jgi:hypothetical protein
MLLAFRLDLIRNAADRPYSVGGVVLPDGAG